MTEIIQGQVFDLHGVALRAETELLRRRNVIELAVVARCHSLEAITKEVTVKLHEEARQGQVVGWDMLLEFPLVGVAVGWVL